MPDQVRLWETVEEEEGRTGAAVNAVDADRLLVACGGLADCGEGKGIKEGVELGFSFLLFYGRGTLSGGT